MESVGLVKEEGVALDEREAVGVGRQAVGVAITVRKETDEEVIC